MEEQFFRYVCPMVDCQMDLHVVRIVGEPLTNPHWLGTTILCCYRCHLIFQSEAITDQMPFIGISTLRREKKRKINLRKVIETYIDLIAMIRVIRDYCNAAYREPTLNERSLHIISSLFTYLTRLQSVLEASIANLSKHLGD